MEPEIIPPNAPEPDMHAPRSRTALIVGGTLAVLIVGAGVAAATGNGFGRGFGGHPHWGGGFMEYGIERALDEVDATPEQTEKIWKIIDAARAEMRPVARGFRDSREQVMELLGATTVDRAAAEKLRAERNAAADQASRRMTTAILDIAEVLTPEQRAELAEHIKDRGGHRRW